MKTIGIKIPDKTLLIPLEGSNNKTPKQSPKAVLTANIQLFWEVI